MGNERKVSLLVKQLRETGRPRKSSHSSEMQADALTL